MTNPHQVVVIQKDGQQMIDVSATNKYGDRRLSVWTISHVVASLLPCCSDPGPDM